MHHTQFKHSDLEIVFPQSCPAKFLSRPQSTSTPRSLLLKLPLHLLNFALFTIPMLAHIPTYISGTLASRYLATKGEEETQAEYKAVIGGLGYGGGLSLALGLFWKKRGLEMVCAALRLEFGGGRMAGLKRVLGLLGLAYGGVWALTKWHNALIDGMFSCSLRNEDHSEGLCTGNYKRSGELSYMTACTNATPQFPTAGHILQTFYGYRYGTLRRASQPNCFATLPSASPSSRQPIHQKERGQD